MQHMIQLSLFTDTNPYLNAAPAYKPATKTKLPSEIQRKKPQHEQHLNRLLLPRRSLRHRNPIRRINTLATSPLTRRTLPPFQIPLMTMIIIFLPFSDSIPTQANAGPKRPSLASRTPGPSSTAADGQMVHSEAEPADEDAH